MKIRITKDFCGVALWHLPFWLGTKNSLHLSTPFVSRGPNLPQRDRKVKSGPYHGKSPLQITGQGWSSTAMTLVCWAVSMVGEGVATPSSFFCALVSGTCVQRFQLQWENRCPPTVVVRAERGGQPQLKTFHIFDLLPPVLEQLRPSREPEWWGLK